MKHRDVMADPFAAADDEIQDATDPMSGLTNLADCMLVLACGLMIALVVHWNLDVSPEFERVEETGDMVVVEDQPQQAAGTYGDPDDEGAGLYENMGTLYRDTATGKLYYLRGTQDDQDTQDAQGNQGEQGAQDSQGAQGKQDAQGKQGAQDAQYAQDE